MPCYTAMFFNPYHDCVTLRHTETLRWCGAMSTMALSGPPAPDIPHVQGLGRVSGSDIVGWLPPSEMFLMPLPFNPYHDCVTLMHTETLRWCGAMN